MAAPEIARDAAVGRVIVNGRPRELVDPPGYLSMLDWLRELGLTGAKEGCAEGECGACAVLVLRPDGADRSRWTAINACLVPAAGLAGAEVVTSEGLGTADDLHPVQREMAVRGGSQCGYCTPGFICAMAAEFYRPDRGPVDGGDPDSDHAVGPNGFDLHALSGNLCRCTGYRPIRDAAFALGAPDTADPLARRRSRPAPGPVPGQRGPAGGMLIRPADLAQALAVLAEEPAAVPIAGCTDWGVEVNIRGVRAPYLVALDGLAELREFRVDDDVVEIGAGLTLSEIEDRLAGRIPLLAQLFPQFASRLIRNGATLGGNLGTGSPIGDTPPALLALEADLVLVSTAGERVVALADYFTGYRRTVRQPGELIKAVRIPRPLSGLTAFHKIAKRAFDDISGVAIAFALRIENGEVGKARIGLGGVAATPIRALATEEALTGRPWDEVTVASAAQVLAAEGTPLDDHRASARYRQAMLGQALPRLFASTDGR